MRPHTSGMTSANAQPDAHTAAFHVVVTRHTGAMQWVASQLGQPVRSVTHLEPEAVEPGGCYYGVFPLNLAAAICAAGSQCWAISLNLPESLRGQELSAEQLTALDARLVRYDVCAQAVLAPAYGNTTAKSVATV